MKNKAVLMLLVLALSLMTGCNQANNQPTTTATPTTTVAQTTAEATDGATSASIVNTEEAFEKAISNTGTWIICALKDMTFDKELVLDGEFKNGKKDDAGNDIIQRKIALYEQDSDRNVTARYTLTAPKLTINSPNARIQSGTFVGDIYVAAKNFELVDAKVEGNIYFTNEEAQSTFKMDETSSVTGKQELKA